MTSTLDNDRTAALEREADAALEELAFQPSASPSLGVELEYQILDRETGDLSPGAVRLLPLCEEEAIEGVSAELLQSMIEIKTGVCTSVADVEREIVQRTRRVRNIASSLGYDLAMAGMHPFNRSISGAVYPANRYEGVKQRMGWLTYQIVCFGLHVHVGAPSGDMAIGVTNLLVQYLPHLLALSANSPFWQGVDTGLASTRSALFRLAPHVGIPYYFANWDDFTKYVETMRGCHAIQNTKDIHWDIRPRPQTGTIEFRVCDVPASLAETFALVAFIRSMVVAAQRRLEENPGLCRGDLRSYWIVPENKWLAARYGLRAQCIRSPGARQQPLAEEVAALVERLRPIAVELGDAAFLSPLENLDRFESGAERQRRIYRDAGDWKPVVEFTKSRLAQELAAPE